MEALRCPLLNGSRNESTTSSPLYWKIGESLESQLRKERQLIVIELVMLKVLTYPHSTSFFAMIKCYRRDNSSLFLGSYAGLERMHLMLRHRGRPTEGIHLVLSWDLKH